MTTGGATPTHGLPWPDGAATADGSQDLKDLALATDTALTTIVNAGTAQPTFVADGIWADTAAPVASATIPDYVDAAGDTMSGPLVVPAPTLITQAGRWADGLPRFANAAARDAAYVTIGGAQEGMRCFIATPPSQQEYRSGAWRVVDAVGRSSRNPAFASMVGEASSGFAVGGDSLAGQRFCWTINHVGNVPGAPVTCWISPRITGGTFDNVFDKPFLVSMPGTFTQTASGLFICAGGPWQLYYTFRTDAGGGWDISTESTMIAWTV